MKENIYRTHSCGELRKENIGQTVRLAGFVESIRKMGGICFVTLRDHYGVTQIIVGDEKMLEGVSKECTITVTGKVIERESKNKNMPTGDIEVEISKLQLLGKCQSVLPFEIKDANNVKEELKLQYRYLDLRNSVNHERVVKRAKILQFVRNKLSDLGFVEVQTPILTSSSPEGARDYLVPTILAPTQFYALPQAPQQFKQLLMVSGFDKYFQIAPCFRNEAARADRTPGEFYQIDMEMSFATQEDVFAVCEDLSYEIYSKFTDFEISAYPYTRIPYKVAMDKYCSDKPDLRNPLLVTDVSYIFANTSFNAFKGKTVKMLCAHTGEQTRKFYDNLTEEIVKNEGKGLAWFKYNGELVGSAVKFMSQEEIDAIVKLSNAQDGDSIFLIADEKPKATLLAGVLRNVLGETLGLIDKNKVAFCWIVDFPFYEYNEDEQKIDFSHNPFSMPQGGLDALLNKDPLDIVAYQYDLVCNGYEMLSGAVRNHEQDVMVKAFEIAGYDRSVVESKFPALFNAFSYGAPPHAGGAFGFDRMLMPLMNAESIRDVITFPLNKNGKDLLMSAPSTVSDKQLRDVGLMIRETKQGE